MLPCLVVVRSLPGLLAVALLAVVLLPAAARAEAQPPLGAWAAHEQRLAVQRGLMAPLEDGGLHGERTLSAAQARTALGALAAKQGVVEVPVVGATPPSVFRFDALLVAQLGLGDVAQAVQAETRRAGLRPGPWFGTEVVARLAGLRHDQPFGRDALELYPSQPITRAEAAWSLARAWTWDGSQQSWMRAALADYRLPTYGPAQLRVLRRAVAKVGMPYVWGGELDTASSALGGQAHGGYDCSGFLWRITRLVGDPLGRRITGRTAAQQASEASPAARVRLTDVRAGDLLSFGPARFGDRATERGITHTGIALSDAFMLQSASSYGGVSVAPLLADDGRDRHFSWARRIL